METIIFPPNAVFHTLTHFETLDERVRAELSSVWTGGER